MKVINNTLQTTYPEDPTRYFNFEDFEDQATDCRLFIGGHPDPSIYEDSVIPKYFFSTEEQTWPRDTTDNYISYTDKILTICPPNITGRLNRQAAFFPIHESFVPPQVDKRWEVIYTGLATGHHVDTILNTIRQFNYRLVSYEPYGGLTTDIGVGYLEKLNLIAQSEVCVVHNLTGSHSPQLKSRVFEAAFCRSLMVVQKDEWNIVEEWFTPNVDFVYFNDKTELNRLIRERQLYKFMTHNAYDKAMREYTSEQFIRKYVGFK